MNDFTFDPDHLVINEIFGNTVQGEGRYCGEPAIFLRLAFCRLKCCWCDVPESWDWKRFDIHAEAHKKPIDDVVVELRRLKREIGSDQPHLVISGGEPLLQQEALWNLVDQTYNEFFVEIETAGTVIPEYDMANNWNVSPKLAHSKNSKKRRFNLEALRKLDFYDADFKFVVESIKDFEEIDEILSYLHTSNVFCMPLGTTEEELALRSREILPEVIKRGYRLTPRLQIQIFGHVRGT